MYNANIHQKSIFKVNITIQAINIYLDKYIFMNIRLLRRQKDINYISIQPNSNQFTMRFKPVYNMIPTSL